MTRFQKEISGMLGEGWIKSAKKELEKVQAEFNQGKITVDPNGVLRNCIGRVAVEEVCEKCEYLGIDFDEEETEVAREYETRAAIERYKASQKNCKHSNEKLNEMRANFGKNAVVIDVITGKKTKL